jgi:uncharacterized protein
MIRIEGIGELLRRVKPAVERVDAFDWQGIGRDLDQQGNAMMEQLLSSEECRAIAGLYPNDDIFRSRVVMGRHGFGRGEYKYFSYPLPDLLSELRTAVYPHLVPVANRWNDAMGIDARYPEQHADFVGCCHNAGQARPTPLLLQYVESTTTTACTRISTASMSSRSSWLFCCPTPARTSPAASSS